MFRIFSLTLPPKLLIFVLMIWSLLWGKVYFIRPTFNTLLSGGCCTVTNILSWHPWSCSWMSYHLPVLIQCSSWMIWQIGLWTWLGPLLKKRYKKIFFVSIYYKHFLQFPLDYVSKFDPPLGDLMLLSDDPLDTQGLAQQTLKRLLKFKM